MLKRIIWIFTLLIAIALGFMTATWWFTSDAQRTEIRSQGVLEQVRKVFEVVTVEGQFSEIYDYEDYYYYDWSLLRKTALVKIQAKVSMGYDLTDVEIRVDDAQKKIIIGPVPDAEILSMDVKEEFYDIQQGTFNSFRPDDYNKIKEDIREIIRSKVGKSSIPQDARDQLNTLLEGLASLLADYDWTIEISGQHPQTIDTAEFEG